MIGRIVLLLLLASAIVVIVGRLRSLPRPAARPKSVEATEKCPKCGAYHLAGSTCGCDGVNPS